MRISVKDDLDQLSRKLTYLQRDQIPFAVSKTLNQIAFNLSRQIMPQETDKTFEGGATRFTQRGFKYKKSDKRHLWVDIFIDKAQAKYMKFMIAGGTRFPEKRALLVSTQYARLNRYGNMRKGFVKKILADNEKYFSGTPNGRDGPAGIWERYGRTKDNNARPTSKPRSQKIRLVALYSDDAQYTPLFPFAEIGRRAVFSRNDGFAKKFRENLANALATAR